MSTNFFTWVLTKVSSVSIERGKACGVVEASGEPDFCDDSEVASWVVGATTGVEDVPSNVDAISSRREVAASSLYRRCCQSREESRLTYSTR